jgi:site-specific DNA-methyltransferase (adenine-specific)
MKEITLYNGDCLEIMKDIPDKSVDLIICDLPYGCLTTPRASVGPGWRKEVEAGKPKTLYREKADVCAWDVKIDLEAFWKEIKRIRKDDHTPTLHFCTTKFGYDLIQSNPNEFRYDLVWDKQRGVNFLSANKMPMRCHEMIYVFSKAGALYNRIDISGNFPVQGGGRSRSNFIDAINGFKENKKVEAGRRCVKTVIPLTNVLKSDQHPTEKPEALYRFLIERYCPIAGTVLDPTFGSGNSVFTAYAMDRSAIGIEKDEKFFEKAEKRLEAL